jgi:uncharacterized protein YijF (DUF1287 family)
MPGNPGPNLPSKPVISLAIFLWVSGTLVVTFASQRQALPVSLSRQELRRKLVAAAIERTSHSVRYDGTYTRIPYPGGDVPTGVGVCTDEIIRSYRAVGIDLQKEVHEDTLQNFAAYPSKRL